MNWSDHKAFEVSKIRVFHCFFQFSWVQSLSHTRLFVSPWTAARQASLSITISRSSLRLTFIESVMPSSHLILYHPLLLLPPIPPSIRVFSNESTLRMRWPKYWSFNFSILPLLVPLLILMNCPIFNISLSLDFWNPNRKMQKLDGVAVGELMYFWRSY